MGKSDELLHMLPEFRVLERLGLILPAWMSVAAR